MRNVSHREDNKYVYCCFFFVGVWLWFAWRTQGKVEVIVRKTGLDKSLKSAQTWTDLEEREFGLKKLKLFKKVLPAIPTMTYRWRQVTRWIGLRNLKQPNAQIQSSTKPKNSPYKHWWLIFPHLVTPHRWAIEQHNTALLVGSVSLAGDLSEGKHRRQRPLTSADLEGAQTLRRLWWRWRCLWISGTKLPLNTHTHSSAMTWSPWRQPSPRSFVTKHTHSCCISLRNIILNCREEKRGAGVWVVGHCLTSPTQRTLQMQMIFIQRQRQN